MGGGSGHAGRVSGRFAQADLVVLLAGLAAVVAVLAFLVVADRVTDGPPGHVDEWLLRALREPGDPSDPLGPRWLEEAARDLTALGGGAVLTLLVGFVTGYLLLAGRGRAAALVLASTLAGLLLSYLLKEFYARPRPDVVPHLVPISTASFPSGHAMLAAVVYLTLGALLARLVAGWWAKLYFVAAAVVLAALVGASRVYLGVHYPTDVVAGWAAGLAWAVFCWLVARTLQRRHVLAGDTRCPRFGQPARPVERPGLRQGPPGARRRTPGRSGGEPVGFRPRGVGRSARGGRRTTLSIPPCSGYADRLSPLPPRPPCRRGLPCLRPSRPG